MTSPGPKRRVWTVAVLCAALLAAGLVAENLAWLAPLKTAVQRQPSQFPSSLAVPPAERHRPGSVLSVYIEDRYLHHPDYGLLNHRRARGRDWEHPAVMSYFEDGALQFASVVGLRLHGGGTRKSGNRRISVRLYLRREYDPAEFRPGAVFGGRRNPITRLVVRRSSRRYQKGHTWYLMNALAYDIARQTGALAPEVHPVSFVLNGRPHGLYELIEPVRRTFLRSRFGHDRFERRKPTRERALQKRPSLPDDFDLPDPWGRQPFNEALKELRRRAAPFTLAEASRWIDVESLTRWFVSVVFCATTDPFQAVILRDRTQPESLWFWINWDMDHSFRDLYGTAPAPWLHDTFRVTLDRPEIESYLIGRLLAGDPAYRDYVAQEFLDALNYRLTPAFLDERYRHYRAVAERFGLGDEPYLEILADFMEFRSAHVREQIVRELDLAPLRQVRIQGPEGTAFRLNGHAVEAGFSGWYVPGTDIRVEVEGRPPDADFSHWNVDGEQVASPEFRRQVDEDMVIEANFRR